MKIELKNIHYSDALSEETNAFTASLYINGKHAGFTKNDGQGGSTYYWAKDTEGRKAIDAAEAYCKSLPPRESADFLKDGKPMVFEITLESFIDDLLIDYLRAKESARLEKMQRTEIHYGNEKTGVITFLRFRRPLAEIIVRPDGREAIIRQIKERVVPNLEEGMRVLNKNLPEDLLVSAGLKKEQYLSPDDHRVKEAQNPPAKKQQRKKP